MDVPEASPLYLLISPCMVRKADTIEGKPIKRLKVLINEGITTFKHHLQLDDMLYEIPSLAVLPW